MRGRYELRHKQVDEANSNGVEATKYNIAVVDHNQPMLVHKTTSREKRRGMSDVVFLIPELCVVLGLDETLRSDNYALREISSHTRLNPDKRVNALKGFARNLNTNEEVKEQMKTLGLSFSDDLVTVDGTVLNPEPIIMNNVQVDSGENRADFYNSLRDHEMTEVVSLVNWSCISPNSLRSDAAFFINAFNEVSKNLGMSNGLPKMIDIFNDRIQEYINALRQCQGQQLVLILLPNKQEKRYGDIKAFSSHNGILTQCVALRTVKNKHILKNVATKIAMQVNTKLGGVPWNLHIPLASCMIIGFDVYHNKLKNNESYGAVVSSLDKNWTKYHSQAYRHADQTELSSNFSVAAKIAVEAYIQANGKAPEMILVFRDGVGEGQIEYVQNYEVDSIKNSLKMVLGSVPKFAFVVITKRINTRMFQQSGGQSYKNPVPGTVVDEVITRPDRFDFFLVSQNVNQGTVSPTGYNIIDNSTTLTPEKFQRIAYKLTHLYFNWQGTVRQPAPCLYAHKLAYMIGEVTHQNPHMTLEDKLWFL